MSIKPFWLCIRDRDRKLFTIVGPMTDDESWSLAVVTAQRHGRNVVCSTVVEGPTENVKAMFAGYGFTWTQGTLIDPPATWKPLAWGGHPGA